MRSLLAGLAGVVWMTASTSAASLCNCCGASTEQSCAAVCEPVKPPEGQCVPAVDYTGTATIGPNVNPLYDTTLRNIWLGTPGFGELESFRKLLEAARKGVERDRKASLQAFARREIDQAAADAAAKLYETAIVNYYLGLQAYRDAFRDM